MATSYVEYNNFGFWSNDQFLSAILYLVQKNFGEFEESEFVGNVKLDLLDASSGNYSGCIPNVIEDFNDPEKLKYLKHSIQKTLEDLNHNEKELLLEFNKNQVGGYVWQEIPKTEIIRIARLLEKLINGELKTTASSEINY